MAKRAVVSYSMSIDPIEGVCKSPSVWVSLDGIESSIFPVAYIRKPKWMAEDDFRDMVARLRIDWAGSKWEMDDGR